MLHVCLTLTFTCVDIGCSRTVQGSRPQKRSFHLLHCWHVLRHEKWNDECSTKNQKISGNTRSMGAYAPASNESQHDEECECHISPKKNARLINKMSDSPVRKLYKDVSENMWAKKKESKDLKKGKEKNTMIIFLH
jgi:hypothetical protein